MKNPPLVSSQASRSMLPKLLTHSRNSIVVSLSTLLIFSFISMGGCNSRNDEAPLIEFNKIPPAGEGGVEQVAEVAGLVRGAQADEKIVLFAKTDRWWIQPGPEQPYTTIQKDASWSNTIHLGSEYAALLVGPNYRPPPTTPTLPTEGGEIKAVAIVKGLPGLPSAFKTIHFGGYDWKVRSASSNRGGAINLYNPANAWTDDSGALHLRIAMDSGKWRCAEVNMTRSLGYGTYRFVVRDSSFLEPAAVLGMFTWDDNAPEQYYREFGIELTRWGDPTNKNAQFIVEPYYVSANVVRFMAPSGRLTYSFRWQPESLLFAATQGDGKTRQRPIAEHSFTTGIPAPGNESVHMNLYIFGSSRIPLKNQTEVVIEKFEYIP